MDTLKVLIVDDDEDDLILLKDALSLEPPLFQVMAADNPNDALALAREKKFNVALVDVRLGAESGFDLAEKLREINPEMAIIFNTGFPETYVETTSGFEGYLLKGSDGNHLRCVLKNAVHLKQMSVEERLLRDSIYLHLGPEVKQSVCDSFFDLTNNDERGISERWQGRWKDGFPSAWVIYRLGHHSLDRFTIGLASTVGCGFRCRFCMSGKRRYERSLRVEEMLGQFLLSLSSIIAQTMFQKPDEVEIWTSNVCEGDPMRNLDNVMGAIRKLQELSRPRIRSKLTSVGIESQLRRYIDRYIESVPGLRHSWSVHSFQPEIRRWLMPATKEEEFYRIRDLYSQIALITGEPVTDNLILLPGLNDTDDEVEAIARAVGDRPEHRLQLQPFSSAPGFRPRGLKSASYEQLEDLQFRLIKIGFDPNRIDIREIIGGRKYGGCGTTVPEKYANKKKVASEGRKSAGQPVRSRRFMSRGAR